MENELKKIYFLTYLKNKLTADFIKKNLDPADGKILNIGEKKDVLEKFLPEYEIENYEWPKIKQENESISEFLQKNFSENEFGAVIGCKLGQMNIRENVREIFDKLLRTADKFLILCLPLQKQISRDSTDLLDSFTQNMQSSQPEDENKKFPGSCVKREDLEKVLAELDLDYYSTHHLKHKNWLRLNFLNNLLPECPELVSEVEKVNKYYNEKIMPLDFETNGYLSMYYIAKNKSLEKPQDMARKYQINVDFDADYELLIEKIAMNCLAKIISDKNEKITNLQQKMEAVRQLLTQIKHSKTWRYTEPLRKVYTFYLKKIKKTN